MSGRIVNVSKARVACRFKPPVSFATGQRVRTIVDGQLLEGTVFARRGGLVDIDCGTVMLVDVEAFDVVRLGS